MKIAAAMLILLFLTFGVFCCTNEKEHKQKSSVTIANSEVKLPSAVKQKEKAERTTDKQNGVSTMRKYGFPSIMIKNDMRHCEKEGDYSCTPLLGNLIVNGWEASGDKYRRTFIYSSPEITYADLIQYLHFDDSDVSYVNNPNPGEPQALIQTEWLTCKITFLSKVYDGKDKEVKLKAVLIDNEVKANSDRETEYDKNKGIIRRVLDFFRVVHE